MFDRERLEQLASAANPEGIHHTCTLVETRESETHLYECDECRQRFVGMNQMLQHRHLMTIFTLRRLVNDLAREALNLTITLQEVNDR